MSSQINVDDIKDKIDSAATQIRGHEDEHDSFSLGVAVDTGESSENLLAEYARQTLRRELPGNPSIRIEVTDEPPEFTPDSVLGIGNDPSDCQYKLVAFINS